jgi:hypothetical protein
LCQNCDFFKPRLLFRNRAELPKRFQGLLTISFIIRNLGAFFAAAPQKTGLSAPIFFAALPQKRISAAIPLRMGGSIRPDNILRA